MVKLDYHNNFYVFTASLILLLIGSALSASVPDLEGRRLIQLFMFLVQLVAYFSLNLSRAWRLFVLAMLLTHLGGDVLTESTDSAFAPMVGLSAQLLFYCGMAYIAARQVLFNGFIEGNTIAGTIAVYLLLGLIWATLYLIAMEAHPHSFEGINYQNWNDNMGVMVYYSYVTLTTLGYGDITPLTPVARTLSFLEAITGTFYMAVVVASLIGALSRKNIN